MTDPDDEFRKSVEDSAKRNDTALFILIGLMALIVIGGLVYGLSHPTMTSSNPPQTVGSGPSHPQQGRSK